MKHRFVAGGYRFRAIGAALLIALPGGAGLAQERRAEVVVVSTTDVHGRIRGWDYYADTAEPGRGLSRAATIVDSVRAANPGRVILVDAGDLLQGNPLTYAAARRDTAGPHPVVAAMNAMAYDAAAVGNHEFNYGLPTLARALGQAHFPFLAANATWPGHPSAWRAYTIVQRDGVRVGIVGATTPGSMVWDRENLRAGHVKIGEIVAGVRAAVQRARAAGAAVIVVVAHAGLDEPSSYDTVATGLGSENPMARVARDVPGIDVIVYGHSHREMADTTIHGVLLTQARNWATSVSVAHLELARRTGSAGWTITAKHASIVRAAGHAEQAAVVAAAERGHEAARRYAGTVVGRTDTEWRADSARTVDTPLMDFVAETMRRASGADLASVAAFSLDVRIPPGRVTVAQLAQLYPYENTLRALRISGATLKAFLEQSAKYFRVTGDGDAARVGADPAIPGFNFEMVSGADYAIDLSRMPGDRVVGLTVHGKPVRAGDAFTIALSSYRAAGAGGYSMLNGAPVVYDRQLDIRQLLIDEVTRRGTLSPADYFTRNWRLVPPALAARAQASLARERPFDAVGGGVPGAQRASVIRVISTNDFHGAFEARPDGSAGMRGGAAQMATAIHRAEMECAAPACASVLLDGGDLFQGTPASNLAFGRPVVELYDALGYAATALGNHEFDWGTDSLRARMKQAHFAILGANVRYRDGREVDWIRGDTIVERGGVKIGIIGIATPRTASVTKAANVEALRFDDPAAVVDAHAASLRARGADLVVVVAHAGAVCNTDTGCNGEIIRMTQQITQPIDAIVSGHTHSLVNTVVNGTPITQARSSGRAIAVMDIPVDRASRAGALHEVRPVVTDSLAADSTIAALSWRATAAVAALASRPIATVTETMERRGPQHALGNFIADAQRAAAHADVAVMNNGGIRANLQAGAVTYGSLFEVQPFANNLVRVTVRGADLRAYLEQQVARDTLRVHVSGVLMRYDPARPPGARIVSAGVAGAPLDDERVYTVAYTDFMHTGGDALSLAKVALREEAVNAIDLDALIDYAKSQPGRVVRPDGAPRIVRLAP
ncbi:MAG TPA: 5'-nucleotidase C-terminal domain-containing protein [Gemmatimonadaceae bacterium]|nr:5'-nucleotidase C-terminal domain-containing protein [Gemmatimonadaceae bacterium]